MGLRFDHTLHSLKFILVFALDVPILRLNPEIYTGGLKVFCHYKLFFVVAYKRLSAVAFGD